MFSSSCHLISRHLINPVEHNNNTNNSNHNNNKNNSWHPEIYVHWNILSKAHLPGYQAGPYGSRCGLNRNMGWAHHKVHHKPHSYDTIIIKKNDPLILTGVFWVIINVSLAMTRHEQGRTAKVDDDDPSRGPVMHCQGVSGHTQTHPIFSMLHESPCYCEAWSQVIVVVHWDPYAIMNQSPLPQNCPARVQLLFWEFTAAATQVSGHTKQKEDYEQNHKKDALGRVIWYHNAWNNQSQCITCVCTLLFAWWMCMVSDLTALRSHGWDDLTRVPYLIRTPHITIQWWYYIWLKSW